MRFVVLSICFALGLSAAPQASSPYVSVLGTVEKVDASGKAVTVKPDKGGDATTVKYDERTTFSVIPPGETDAKKATPAKESDIAPGDKVLARVLTADPTGKAARTVLIMKQAELAKRKERTLEEWKTATSGIITEIDGKQIKVNARVAGSPAPRNVTVDVSGHVDYERYNPDNGQYEASDFNSIKVGDQLRVLGQKNADSTEIKAENVGTGTFKTIGVLVKTIDPASKQISGTETSSKSPIVITLRGDTSLKKFSDMAAMMVARQLNPTYQQTSGRGRGSGGGGGRGGDTGAAAAGGPPAGAEGAPGGGRGFAGGGRGRGGMDVGRIIEQQPAIQLSDLKPGDAVIVTGATKGDSAKLVAIALVAGVEPILRAAPSNGADPLAGSWNLGGGGGDGN